MAIKPIRIAFSGSGFLGGIHAGAVCAVLDSGYTILEVAGTSGGSIVAAAVASGASANALFDLAVNSDMSRLLTFDPWNLLRTGTTCDGNALFAWLMQNTNQTLFRDSPIDIKIIATDVAAGAPFLFDKKATPDLPLALACRASSAVPFVYAPVNIRGKLLADGGMVNNIPVDWLTADGPVSAGGVLRIGIDVDEPTVYATSPIWSYAKSLVKLLLSANETTQIHLAASTGAAVIKVSAGNADFLDTSMPRAAREQLFDAGYARTKDYLVTVGA